MNVSQLFQIFYARKWAALVVLLLVVGLTAVVSLSLPKKYTAETELLIDAKSKDPITGQLLPSQMFPGYLATQIEIIKSKNVAAKVVRDLKIDKNPQVQADFRDDTGGRGDVVSWMAERLLPGLDVELSRDTNLIVITYTGADPVFASLIANAFAKAYINTTLELRLDPAKQTVDYFDQQITQMRQEFDEAQSKLTAYQRENNLVETEERLDVETRKLTDISGQIVAAQSIAFDASSRAQGGRDIPEVFNSPVAQNLKVQVAQGETRLAELSNRLGTNHPDYQRSLSEVASLRAKLNAELASASRSVGASATAARKRLADLETAFARQKEKVLALKQQREEAQVLARNVENAQRIYDAALQRYGTSRMESQTTQTDVTVLNQAQPPLDPSKPRLQLNLLIAIFAGTLFGLVAALVLELIDRRVRSADDLSRLLAINVLGQTAAQSRGVFRLPGRARRLALGKS